MVRKFLYGVAVLIVLYIGGRLALQFYPEQLSRMALVPSSEFRPQPKLESSVYDKPEMWISRPGIGTQDPARWMPTGANAAQQPVRAAVFFVHPTSYLSREAWNAPLDDAASRQRAEMFTRGLASPFNASEAVWAPRYRQAAFGAFLTDEAASNLALDLAYADVLQAFDYFVASTDARTPIVLAGHSQGSKHLLRLLKDRIAGKPIARRIAAVYAIGWPISLTHDLPETSLPACSAPDQAGCVIGWQSYAEPADPAMVLHAYDRAVGLDGRSLRDSPFLCSNPLTGTQGGNAPASLNLGTLIPDARLAEGRLVAGLVPAACRADGFLSIGAPPEIGPYVLPGNNFHVYDIPLFWANLRADFARRVAAWRP